MTHNAPEKVEQLLDLVTDAHVLYDTGVFSCLLYTSPSPRD